MPQLQRGDTLVVWKLDQLGRSLKDWGTLVKGFRDQGIPYVILQDYLDTIYAQGRLLFILFACQLSSSATSSTSAP